MPEVLGGRSPRPDAAAYTQVLMADKPKKQKSKANEGAPLYVLFVNGEF